MTRVAVAMPVYNDEQYLALALDGLCQQTYRDFHLTIVDDGSTDRSAAVAESFADRLPMTLIRAEHRGLRTTKRAAVEAAPPEAEYLLIHDSDIVLPPDTIERMVATLDESRDAAAIMAQARTAPSRPWSRGQGFMEDLIRHTNVSADGHSRVVVGACVMFRRSILQAVRLRVDVNEDSDLSIQLRDRYRLLWPPDLVCEHHGVPTTVRGLWNRGYRDGLRVRALLRAHPKAGFQFGSAARLVPLPLGAALAFGLLTFQPWLVGAALAAAIAYAGAFLYASRGVPADLRTRLEGTAVFMLSSLGFGVGFLRESLSKPAAEELAEPERSAQR
jgi:glycosyltransferase involved in cell wall biosynthesis